MIRTIMAFDIATHTGVAFGTVGETPRSTTINLGQGKSQELRFAKAIQSTRLLVSKYKPDLIVYEAPVGGKITSHFLVGLAACVVGEARTHTKKLEKLSINAVRKHFLGRAISIRDFPHIKRNDDKRAAVKQAVVARCEILGWKVDSDDAADACACWDYACAHFAKSPSAPLGGLFRG